MKHWIKTMALMALLTGANHVQCVEPANALPFDTERLGTFKETMNNDIRETLKEIYEYKNMDITIKRVKGIIDVIMKRVCNIQEYKIIYDNCYISHPYSFLSYDINKYKGLRMVPVKDSTMNSFLEKLGEFLKDIVQYESKSEVSDTIETGVTDTIETGKKLTEESKKMLEKILYLIALNGLYKQVNEKFKKTDLAFRKHTIQNNDLKELYMDSVLNNLLSDHTDILTKQEQEQERIKKEEQEQERIKKEEREQERKQKILQRKKPNLDLQRKKPNLDIKEDEIYLDPIMDHDMEETKSNITPEEQKIISSLGKKRKIIKKTSTDMESRYMGD